VTDRKEKRRKQVFLKAGIYVSICRLLTRDSLLFIKTENCMRLRGVYIYAALTSPNQRLRKYTFRVKGAQGLMVYLSEWAISDIVIHYRAGKFALNMTKFVNA
jgi:hypothetical protein